MNQNNDKKGFLLYFDSFDNLTLMSDEQRGKLLLALYRYAWEVREGEALTPKEALQRFPELDPQASMAFGFMAANIHRDTEEWLRRRNNYQRAARERIAAKQQSGLFSDASAEHPRRTPPVREERAEKLDAAWQYI